MGNLALTAEHLSKKYTIRERTQGYKTLGESVANAASLPLHGAKRFFKKGSRQEKLAKPHDYWALRDVSFEIKHGEVVGVIGRNGAGKSTLLKILSRITEPTDGHVNVYGRVGALLEVGTGFHPELTGRENVYLNGAILGMPRSEIKSKFDEIVAFAEIDRFLDTPVKRYSSGMQLRLGFAVAAHLDPEILVVDEILAVGDAAFQRKCIGKIQDVARQSRTVLFVSHNIAAIQAICSRGVVLGKGTVIEDGPIQDTVACYLRMLEVAATDDLAQRTDRNGKGEVKLTRIDITAPAGGSLQSGAAARFAFHLSKPCSAPDCGFTIYDYSGTAVTHLNSSVPGPGDSKSEGAANVLVCDIDELTLLPGRYRVAVALQLGAELQDHLASAAMFDVAPGLFRGRQIVRSGAYGSACLDHKWVISAA